MFDAAPTDALRFARLAAVPIGLLPLGSFTGLFLGSGSLVEKAGWAVVLLAVGVSSTRPPLPRRAGSSSSRRRVRS